MSEMSEMVERVARALAAQHAKECDLDAEYVDGAWETHADAARAAIEAMREPTEAIIAAGMWKGSEDAYCPNAETARSWNEAEWRAMIDAALKE